LIISPSKQLKLDTTTVFHKQTFSRTKFMMMSGVCRNFSELRSLYAGAISPGLTMEKTERIILVSLKDRMAQLMSVGLRVDLARVGRHFKRSDFGDKLAAHRIVRAPGHYPRDLFIGTLLPLAKRLRHDCDSVKSAHVKDGDEIRLSVAGNTLPNVKPCLTCVVGGLFAGLQVGQFVVHRGVTLLYDDSARRPRGPDAA
jgi:hypothetical protein